MPAHPARIFGTSTALSFSDSARAQTWCSIWRPRSTTPRKATPQQIIDVNISASRRLFEAAAQAARPKVVFASSLYAYGSMGPAPMRETDVPTPDTVYGISKVAGEQLLRLRYDGSMVPWSVARLFFVYGPRQYARGGYKSVIVANFERLVRGEAPTIFGDGLQALDYVYIDDVVEALIELAAPAHNGKTLNICSGLATTINDLTAAMIATSKVRFRLGRVHPTGLSDRSEWAIRRRPPRSSAGRQRLPST